MEPGKARRAEKMYPANLSDSMATGGWVDGGVVGHTPMPFLYSAPVPTHPLQGGLKGCQRENIHVGPKTVPMLLLLGDPSKTPQGPAWDMHGLRPLQNFGSLKPLLRSTNSQAWAFARPHRCPFRGNRWP